MNWADYAIIAMLALSVLTGLWRGFVGEVLALAVWGCAFWAAWLLGPALAERFSASISTPSARMMLGYVACFVTVLIAGAVVTFLMRKLVEGSGLSGSDRLLGMVFGFVRGLALVVLVVFVAGALFKRDPWWHESRLLPEFQVGADWLAARLPQEVTRYLAPVEALAQPLAQPSAPAPAPPPVPKSP